MFLYLTSNYTMINSNPIDDMTKGIILGWYQYLLLISKQYNAEWGLDPHIRILNSYQ